MAETKTRRCNKCGKRKRITRFYWQTKGGKRYRRSVCINCHLEGGRQDYRKRDPHKHNTAQRRAHVKRRFGLSPADYSALLEKQGGVCAICHEDEKTISSRGVRHNLAVDHDHKTGRVRGLLCKNCNSAIGQLQDDPMLMLSAMAYLGAG